MIALIAESNRRATPREIDAFSTPTIVHFAGVLVVAAIVSAPWYELSHVAVVLGACGLTGIAYILIVIRRARSQTTYHVVFEDWLWHFILPLLAYVLLLVSAVFLPGHAHRVLFVIGTIAMLLLFVGLHNAWDTVTYITIAIPAGSQPEVPAPEQRSGAVEATDTNQSTANPKHEHKPGKRRGEK